MAVAKEKHKLKLQHRIGKGAFGDVFKGTLDGETVAIKTIGSSHLDNAIAQEMFLREARVLEACGHRNIIGFKKLCKINNDVKPGATGKPDPGKWAMVLEYARGGTLFKKISAQMVSPGSTRVYSEVQALTWALQVASALEFLHLRSPAIFHRDVKLSNVMLSSSPDGQLEAKLSDFGLHVVADSTRDRHIRISSALARSIPANIQQQDQQQLLLLQQLLPQQQQQQQQQQRDAGCVGFEFCGDSAWQQRHQDALQQKQSHSAPVGVAGSFRPHAGVSQADQLYSEFHDSGGSMSFVGPSERAAADTNSCIRPHGSWNAATTAAAAAVGTAQEAPAPSDAEAQQQQQQQQEDSNDVVRAPASAQRAPAARRPSFRRAAHHPAGDLSVPRVGAGAGVLPLLAAGSASELQMHASCSGPSSIARSFILSGPGGAGGAGGALSFTFGARPSFPLHASDGGLTARNEAEQSSAVAGCAGYSFTCQGVDARSEAGSLGTDATWESHSGWTSKANSCCSSTDDDYGSLASELETVFDMTGLTGSCLYMAPEVFHGQPYNEKADVFSFGVVLYELTARCLIMFTELPTSSSDPAVATHYARKVAEGYRPSRPKRFSDHVWELIAACWQQEPIHRPHMSEVVDVLTKLLEQEKASRGGGRASIGRRPSGTFTRATSGGLPTAVPESHAVGMGEAVAALQAAHREGGDVTGDRDRGALPAHQPAPSSEVVKASQGCACVVS